MADAEKNNVYSSYDDLLLNCDNCKDWSNKTEGARAGQDPVGQPQNEGAH
jgi:hypothetical protein